MDEGHEVDCECNGISGKDLLGFDESCGCEKDHIVDPDADIERRITAQVEKSISDILSEIVNRCVSSSLHDCIQIA